MCAFIGISLHHAKDYKRVIEALNKLDSIVEAYYTTGEYNIFAKVFVESIEALHQLLLRVQAIREVHSTSTSVVLSTDIERPVAVEN